MKKTVLFALLANGLVGLAAAEDYSEVLVTASSSKLAMPLRQVGTAVTVLDAEDIALNGNPVLLDVLRTQPAVGASNAGGPGKVSALRIRGEEGFRTLILIDGIEVSDPAATQVTPVVEHIMSSHVSRVEILRGPQGMMYGADAGGVVSITTGSAEPGLHGGAEVELGAFDTRQVGGYLGFANDRFDGYAAATDYRTDGYNARPDDQLLHDDDGYDNTTGHVKLGWNIADHWRVQAVYRSVEGDSEYDNCGFDPVSHACESDYQHDMGRLSLHYNGKRFSHQLGWAQAEVERQDYADRIAQFGSEGELTKIDYLGSFKLSDDNSLVYGVDWRDEDVVTSDGQALQRDQLGYYAEYQGVVAQRLYFTAGVRRDDNDSLDDAYNSYRVSLAYLVPLASGEIKLKSSYGTGFRVPSLYELAYNAGPWSYPPASLVQLTEETSRGFELGLEYLGAAGAQWQLVYFDHRIDDEIYFDNAGFSGYLQADGDSRSRGIELVGELALADSLSLQGNYTYADADDNAGEPRLRRPTHLANLGLRWALLDQRLQVLLNARGSRDALAVDGSELDDYVVLDLSANWALTDNWQLHGRWQNMLDKDYVEVAGYNTAGSALYAGVRYQF